MYGSMSGHGFIIGYRTGNIICFKVKSKSCAICARENSFNVHTEEHDRTINWEGTSGGMEEGVELEMCVKLHNSFKYNIFVEFIVSDDDSIMRPYLQHDGKGKLPASIPIPTFKTDPSRRIKVMAGPIFRIVKDTKNKRV